ncbi:MAG TPA: NAD(P)-dependent oxidoreductase [Longimicrobiales bacterium]|nr:NAD(P)-dependent oxidoreductase [Longimicrobiales bacterium]
MKRALVTGATGMLGSYVALRLRREGWEVRALCRRPEEAGWLSDRDIELAPGDLVDARSVRTAAGTCRAVVHAAAIIGTRGGVERFREVNVGGTRNVVAAAAAEGARLVHVSSTAVFGRARYRSEPTDESAPLPDLPVWDAYGRTKQESERLVLEAHRQGRIRATVVRPPVMYGVRDRQFMPRIGPVLERGVFPLVEGGRATLALVHADSVADGVVRALERDGAAGRIYHLTNDFEVTVADLARHARGTLEMLTRDNPFTSLRARRELGWAPAVPPSEGLPEAFRWWRSASAPPRWPDERPHRSNSPHRRRGPPA